MKKYKKWIAALLVLLVAAAAAGIVNSQNCRRYKRFLDISYPGNQDGGKGI